MAVLCYLKISRFCLQTCKYSLSCLRATEHKLGQRHSLLRDSAKHLVAGLLFNKYNFEFEILRGENKNLKLTVNPLLLKLSRFNKTVGCEARRSYLTSYTDL